MQNYICKIATIEEMNIKWDLPMEILEQLDKFDNLEQYIENLRKEVEILY